VQHLEGKAGHHGAFIAALEPHCATQEHEDHSILPSGLLGFFLEHDGEVRLAGLGRVVEG
jgi:hypothetical protein